MVDGWAPWLVLIFEYTFFVGFFGQTVGMRLARFTCTDAQTGRPPGVMRAFVRGLGVAFVVPALFGWHDRLAGTALRSLEPQPTA
jgi:hypothetical protein